MKIIALLIHNKNALTVTIKYNPLNFRPSAFTYSCIAFKHTLTEVLYCYQFLGKLFWQIYTRHQSKILTTT